MGENGYIHGVALEGRHGHIVAATASAWGHARAACSLLCKLVRLRNIYATFLVPLPLYEKVVHQIARSFLQGKEDDLKAMIRIVTVECDPMPTEKDLLEQNLIKIIKDLFVGEQLGTYPGGANLYEDIGPPRLLLLDIFLYGVFTEVRKISDVPVHVFQSGAATALLFIAGPEYLGGNGDLLEKLKPIMDLPEDEKNKEAERLYRRVQNKLLDIPGLPPMHDYEHYPQKCILQTTVAFFTATLHRFFTECDGMISNTTPLLEGPALEAWQAWFKERPVINPGPSDFQIIDHVPDQSPDARKVNAFLDSALERFGQNSVVYISFGSVWWMTDPEKIWVVLDVLIELSIPFIFSHASPFAVVPPEVIDKIKTCGFGYEATWLPQTDILKHPACGWFVSHCGHNSVMESLSEGVPMICWPFDVDQPSNAVNVAFVHEMGYELFEVRSGYGVLPIHRLGNRVPTATVDTVREEFYDVMTKAMGEDGKQKRENALRFRASLSESWQPGGNGWKELEKIAAVLRA